MLSTKYLFIWPLYTRLFYRVPPSSSRQLAGERKKVVFNIVFWALPFSIRCTVLWFFFSFLPTRKYCSISFKKCWNIVVQSFVLKFDVWRYQWLLASGSFPRPVPLTAKSVQVLPRRSTPVPRSQFVFFSTHQSYYNILKGYFYYN